MILKFRHKGLKRLFENGDHRGVNPMLAEAIDMVLDMLDEAYGPEAVNVHGYRLGQWSMTISGNWRIVFEFEGKDVTNVDLVDYH